MWPDFWSNDSVSITVFRPKVNFSPQTQVVREKNNTGLNGQNFGHLIQPVTKDLRDHRYPSVLELIVLFYFLLSIFLNFFFNLFRPASDCRLLKFGILLKLHKPKLGIRPIVNFRNNPMENFSKFLDFLLGPIVKNTESYTQDSQ